VLWCVMCKCCSVRGWGVNEVHVNRMFCRVSEVCVEIVLWCDVYVDIVCYGVCEKYVRCLESMHVLT